MNEHSQLWEYIKQQQKGLKRERLCFAVTVAILVTAIIATNAIWILSI